MRITNLIKRKKHDLVMTLLVRDEEDILEKNIKYHLNNGVDFIIATDNLSKDRTPIILKKYEKMGKLLYLKQDEENYQQAEWVNNMGRIAKDSYKAKYIFHSDADEFWYPKNGNLKTEFLCSKNKYFKVKLKNVLPVYNSFKEDVFSNSYIINKPIITNDLMKDSLNMGIYFFEYPPKVMYDIESEYVEVTQGNHNIKKYSENLIFSKNITIYHFPIRSWSHFRQKVIQGGKSYENNKTLPKDAGYHWRRWYDLFKKGKLKDEYINLILSDKNIYQMEKEGTIKHFNVRVLV